MDIERIGESDEQIEECTVVHGLSDLRIRPSHVPKGLHLFVGNSIRVTGQRTDEFKQQTLRRRYGRAVQITIPQRLDDLSGTARPATAGTMCGC